MVEEGEPTVGEAEEEGITLEDAGGAASPPMVAMGTQPDVFGRGCAAGVAGSPWWKVEAP